MEYNKALKQFNKTFCPFCNEKPENIIEINNYFYIPSPRAPYTKDHLLVVPRRHICFLGELKNKESKEMYDIIEKRTDRLHKKHKDVNLLLRDWLVWWKSLKSINHLHFHLIPDCAIYSDNNSENRIFLSEKDYGLLTKKIRTKFL